MVSEENQVNQLQVENKRIEEELVRVQQENSELTKQCNSYRRFILDICKTIEEKVELDGLKDWMEKETEEKEIGKEKEKKKVRDVYPGSKKVPPVVDAVPKIKPRFSFLSLSPKPSENLNASCNKNITITLIKPAKLNKTQDSNIIPVTKMVNLEEKNQIKTNSDLLKAKETVKDLSHRVPSSGTVIVGIRDETLTSPEVIPQRPDSVASEMINLEEEKSAKKTEIKDTDVQEDFYLLFDEGTRKRKCPDFFGEKTSDEEYNQTMKCSKLTKIPVKPSSSGTSSQGSPCSRTERKVSVQGSKTPKEKLTPAPNYQKNSTDELKESAPVIKTGYENLEYVNLTRCRLCSEYFASKAHYDHHRYLEHPQCCIEPDLACEEMFLTRIDMYKHVMIHHEGQGVEGKLKYCPLCGCWIDVKSIYHHKPEGHTLPCHKCQLKFTNKKELLQHVAAHLEEEIMKREN